jgi:hypothetical protein
MTGWQPLAKRVMFVVIFAFFVWAIGRAADAEAHLIRYPDHPNRSVLENRERSQERNLGHARYVCRQGGGEHKRWACKAQTWIASELAETRESLSEREDSLRHAGDGSSADSANSRSESGWAAVQMMYGNRLAADSAGDPWPNCPDPHDGSGASWYATVACENNGSWLDSPGYYRCGLQFDPMWERFYGRRFCP